MIMLINNDNNVDSIYYAYTTDYEYNVKYPFEINLYLIT